MLSAGRPKIVWHKGNPIKNPHPTRRTNPGLPRAAGEIDNQYPLVLVVLVLLLSSPRRKAGSAGKNPAWVGRLVLGNYFLFYANAVKQVSRSRGAHKLNYIFFCWRDATEPQFIWIFSGSHRYTRMDGVLSCVEYCRLFCGSAWGAMGRIVHKKFCMAVFIISAAWLFRRPWLLSIHDLKLLLLLFHAGRCLV